MTIDLTHEIEMDEPAEAVWTILSDYGMDPRWRAGVRSMAPTPSGPVAVGTTTAEELRLAGRTYRNDGIVTAVDEGRRFEWRTTKGADANGARSVAALDADRCRVRLELSARPRGIEQLFAPVTRRVLDANLRGDLARLAAVVARVRQPS
jgi:uncharacterized membrane protein